jgi:hypothetical protein
LQPAVVNHPHRLELPQRRGLRVVLAQLAGAVDHLGELAAPVGGHPAAGGGEPRAVGEQHAEAAHGAALEIAGELGVVGEHHLARRLEHGDVARRGDHVAALVVRQGVGAQHPLAAGELDRAGGGDDAEPVVVDDLVGKQQHLALGQCLCARLAAAGQPAGEGEQGEEQNQTRAAAGHGGSPQTALRNP